MSDFDEEAERERLREKYEQEEKEREATEQMSELLLKGATMTNAHCSDCGDPIFRYDGQEFCPTCEKPVDRGQGEAEEGDDASDENGESPGQVEVAAPSDDARVRFGGADEPADAAEEADAAAEQGTDQHAEDAGAGTPPQGEPARQPADSPRIDDEQPVQGGSPTQGQPTHQPADANATAAATGDVGSNVASARASLARTAARFARAAEDTDDPAVAREHLAAAREAAEALDELD